MSTSSARPSVSSFASPLSSRTSLDLGADASPAERARREAFQKKMGLFKEAEESSTAEGVSRQEWLSRRKDNIDTSLRSQRVARAQLSSVDLRLAEKEESAAIQRLQRDKQEVEALMAESRHVGAPGSSADQRKSQDFSQKIAAFRTGEDAALSQTLSAEEWLHKKHANLSHALRSREDVRVARLAHEEELRRQTDERIRQLEQMRKDVDLALALVAEDNRQRNLESEAAHRRAHEEERVTMEMLAQEEMERQRLAQEEAQLLQTLRKEAEAEEEARRRREEEGERRTLELLKREQRGVPAYPADDEEFGFEGSPIESDAQLARSLSHRERGQELLRKRQMEEDERLARLLSGENEGDEEIARNLQKMEVRAHQASRSSSLHSLTLPAPTSPRGSGHNLLLTTSSRGLEHVSTMPTTTLPRSLEHGSVVPTTTSPRGAEHPSTIYSPRQGAGRLATPVEREGAGIHLASCNTLYSSV